MPSPTKIVDIRMAVGREKKPNQALYMPMVRVSKENMDAAPKSAMVSRETKITPVIIHGKLIGRAPEQKLFSGDKPFTIAIS